MFNLDLLITNNFITFELFNNCSIIKEKHFNYTLSVLNYNILCDYKVIYNNLFYSIIEFDKIKYYIENIINQSYKIFSNNIIDNIFIGNIIDLDTQNINKIFQFIKNKYSINIYSDKINIIYDINKQILILSFMFNYHIINNFYII